MKLLLNYLPEGGISDTGLCGMETSRGEYFSSQEPHKNLSPDSLYIFQSCNSL
jgi:hypothetical protein